MLYFHQVITRVRRKGSGRGEKKKVRKKGEKEEVRGEREGGGRRKGRGEGERRDVEHLFQTSSI